MQDDLAKLLDEIFQRFDIPEQPMKDDSHLKLLAEMLQWEADEFRNWEGESPKGSNTRDKFAEGFQGPLLGPEYPVVKPSLQAAAAWAEIKLAERQSRFEAGDSKALFEAVRFCYFFCVPMPSWVGHGILDGLLKVENFELGSWDGAYGGPYPRKTRLPERRRRLVRAGAVAWEVEELSVTGTPIDDFIWEKVAENLNAKNKDGKLFEGGISGREAKSIWQENSPVVLFVKGRLAEVRRGKNKKSRLIDR